MVHNLKHRLHAELVTDALLVRGVHVEHIMSAVQANPHRMTLFARVTDGELTYPDRGPSAKPVAAGSGVCYKTT